MSTQQKRSVSIIIPVFNEVSGVKATLDGLSAVMTPSRIEYEIILVEDGSTDGTREYLEKTAPGRPVSVVFHKKNRGYGAALKTGIRNAKYDVVFIADCDGTYPVERIPAMAELIFRDECDMIVGARTGRDAAIPLIRRPAKWFIQVLANYLTGETIPDLNSGLRGMKKEAVQKFLYLLPDGFSFTTTITIAMMTNEYRVEYVKIDYHKRIGRSKIHPFRDTVNFVKLVIRTVLYFNPLKIFLPATGILFVSAAAVFIYSSVFMPKVYDDTVVTLLMAAFQIFAIGLIADLMDKKIKQLIHNEAIESMKRGYGD
jgi:glycosyltransferase involved in cell wall biosynthesis